MAFIPVANTAMAELIFEHDGVRSENVMYFEHADPIDGVELLDLVDTVRAWWTANMKALMSDEYSLVLIRVSDISSQDGLGYESSEDLPVAGTYSAEALPANCTLSTKFITGQRGRSFRGRNYFVGLVGDEVETDLVKATFVSAILAAYEALLTAMDTTNWTWVVVSRYHNNAPRSSGITTPIIGVSCDRVVDSQRRRLPGRGA